MVFTKKQKNILKRAGINLVSLSEEQVFKIVNHEIAADKLNDKQLLEFLQVANATYRGGENIVSDSEYDFIYLNELQKRNPEHPFLNKVEPEAVAVGKTVELPERMLSTEKAYSRAQIDRWLDRIVKAASDQGIDANTLIMRVTPKLDGFAAYDDGQRFYTRGDGKRGTDISKVFARGLKVGGNGKRGQGPGEIVVDKDYFEQHLSKYFENSRNFQTSIIAEKKVDENAQKAISDEAVVFMPFVQLPSWEGTMVELRRDFDNIINRVWDMVAYDVDGVILEINDKNVKEYMGATQHHHRWQIAFKANEEKAQVRVVQIRPQTSRSGRVNPVAELEPTRLSGVTISRATAHHYGMVKEKRIGPDAIIELVRSGQVIPKIERVITPSTPQIPTTCPSCGFYVVWEGDYLYCPNTLKCPAQIENTIEHFFSLMRNVDGFGSKTIQKLFENNIRSIYSVYTLQVQDLIDMGFGEKTSQNLISQLVRSRTEPIEDYRFIAAFGVYRLGIGNSERLLRQYRLDRIFDLSEQDIAAIAGFAELTAKIVVDGFKSMRDEFQRLYNLGFNLERTPLASEMGDDRKSSKIAGKLLVFTGTMKHGSRDELETEAKKNGAKIGKSVTGKTDYLIVGENVGATKINDARAKGITVINENEYISLLKNTEK